MSKRSKYSIEEKYQIISEVIEKHCSMNNIAKKYNISFILTATLETMSRCVT